MKQILRERDVLPILGCKHTKFVSDYRYTEGGAKTVPGTNIPRLRPLDLGPRNLGYLASEVDALIDALAAERDKPRRKRAAS